MQRLSLPVRRVLALSILALLLSGMWLYVRIATDSAGNGSADGSPVCSKNNFLTSPPRRRDGRSSKRPRATCVVG